MAPSRDREVGVGNVDVGHEHRDAHGAALSQILGRRVLVVLDRGEEGGEVGHRVMGLEPRRLVADEPVAVGVRLVEGVVGERLDDVEELLAQVLAVAGVLTALLELGPLEGHDAAVLLACGLADRVGLGQRIAGELLGHPHDRLLVDHEPVGVAKDGFELGVLVVDRLATVLAIGEVVVHVGRHRARPVQRDEGGDIVERRGRQGAHQRPHGSALELEHPHRVASAE